MDPLVSLQNINNIANASLNQAVTTQFAADAQSNINTIDLLAENNGFISGVNDDERPALTAMIENSAQVSGTIAVDAVRDVPDSCILESTKTKNINQAILYIFYAMKCAGSADKKDLDNENFCRRYVGESYKRVQHRHSTKQYQEKTTAPDSSFFFLML